MGPVGMGIGVTGLYSVGMDNVHMEVGSVGKGSMDTGGAYGVAAQAVWVRVWMAWTA